MEENYEKHFIKLIANEEECVFIIPSEVLKQANIGIGDKCITVVKQEEIIIKKIKNNNGRCDDGV